MPGPFSKVSVLRPGRSVFDLSYSKIMTMDMGQLVPVMHDEVYPGDEFDIGTDMVVRMQPLVSPVMHEIYATVHYFFVQTRRMWDKWEDFITGGEDGKFDEVANPPPRWNPTSTVVGSLWDMFGFPVGVTPTGALPIQFPLNAYNDIWNNYYRDQNTQAEVALNQDTVLKRTWAKDYFGAALPWQQRGIAPALPISGRISAEFASAVTGSATFTTGAGPQTGQVTFNASNQIFTGGVALNNNLVSIPAANLNANTVDLSTATTFNVADLRLAFQVQKWMERNARAGARYTESLKAHFGVSNGDERLQRPEYIGGVKFPVIVSEVLQTSETTATSPQGNMSGRGLTAGQGNAGKYKATEHGWIMGIMSIMPVPMYSQGIDRQYLRRSRYDYYFPEFANLSEQAIERAEIYATAVEAENRTEFGFIGRFDEMRVKRNLVTGLLRTDLNHWHLGRVFSSAPLLNSAFQTMDSTTGGASNSYKRIFAVPSEPGFIVHVSNRIKAIRPLPIQSEPGMIDHS